MIPTLVSGQSTWTGSRAGIWTTTGLWGADLSSTGWDGFTLRNRIHSTVLPTGSKIRLTFTAAASGGFSIDAAYVQFRNTAGDLYDFTTTPIAITFSGLSNVTVTAGNEVVTDEITIAIDGTKDIVVAVHFDATSSIASLSNPLLVSWMEGYYKAADDAATVDASGYTSGEFEYLITKVEVFT